MFVGAVWAAVSAGDGKVLAIPAEAQFLAPLAFLGGTYPAEFSLLLVCELGLRSASRALPLLAPAPFLTVCLLALRTRDLVFPSLAGMGRTKTWWSVLPIVRARRLSGGQRQTMQERAAAIPAEA